MVISLILFVIVIILAAYFASNNLAPITLNLLGYPIHGTTGVVLVAALGLGLLLGILFMLPTVISRSWAVIRHRRKLEDLQAAMRRSAPKDEDETD